jgi:hypothetical protein
MLERIAGIVFPIYAIVAIGYAYGRWKKPDMGSPTSSTWMSSFRRWCSPRWPRSPSTSASNLPLLARRHRRGAGLGPAGLADGAPAGRAGEYLRAADDVQELRQHGLAADGAGLRRGCAAGAAVVLFFCSNFLHYSLGTWMLDHRARLISLWRVPVIAATLAGLAVSLLQLPLWQPLWLGIKMLGDISIPLLLFALGVRLTDSRHADWKLSRRGGDRPAAGIMVALAMNQLLGLDGRDAAMLIVFGALPPAVLNYIFAERYAAGARARGLDRADRQLGLAGDHPADAGLGAPARPRRPGLPRCRVCLHRRSGLRHCLLPQPPAAEVPVESGVRARASTPASRRWPAPTWRQYSGNRSLRSRRVPPACCLGCSWRGSMASRRPSTYAATPIATRIRRCARALLQSPPLHLSQVLAAWKKELDT